MYLSDIMHFWLLEGPIHDIILHYGNRIRCDSGCNIHWAHLGRCGDYHSTEQARQSFAAREKYEFIKLRI